MQNFKCGTVAIIGRPNAGKSTLLNRVLGAHLSIVTPKAQTTRFQTRGILNEVAGQMVFIDTPGIHRAREGGLNEAMVREAKNSLEDPDLIWYLVDPLSKLEHEDAVLECLVGKKSSVMLLLNKCDDYRWSEPFKDGILQKLKRQGNHCEKVFELSALNGQGVSELMQTTWAMLPVGEALYPVENDSISDRPVRFFVAEFIREQLFLQLGDELPYGCAVEIAAVKEDAQIMRVDAVIHVERDSQKGMVIGAGGARIKKIGEKSRARIEDLVGQKVFLGLKVKVNKDWSKRSDALKKMGFLVS